MSMMALANKQGAHSHGAAKLNLAFEGKKGTLEVHAPAEVVYGFEYQASSSKDKAKKEQGLKKLEDKISEMVVLDPALKCEIKKDIFEVNQRSSHADIEAVFQIVCENSPKESKVVFNIQKVFPRMKVVELQIVADDVQKAETVKKDGSAVELK